MKNNYNVEEAWFSVSIREITFREQELNWLFAKYKRLENNPLYGTSVVEACGKSKLLSKKISKKNNRKPPTYLYLSSTQRIMMKAVIGVYSEWLAYNA